MKPDTESRRGRRWRLAGAVALVLAAGAFLARQVMPPPAKQVQWVPRSDWRAGPVGMVRQVLPAHVKLPTAVAWREIARHSREVVAKGVADYPSFPFLASLSEEQMATLAAGGRIGRQQMTPEQRAATADLPPPSKLWLTMFRMKRVSLQYVEACRQDGGYVIFAYKDAASAREATDAVMVSSLTGTRP